MTTFDSGSLSKEFKGFHKGPGEDFLDFARGMKQFAPEGDRGSGIFETADAVERFMLIAQAAAEGENIEGQRLTIFNNLADSVIGNIETLQSAYHGNTENYGVQPVYDRQVRALARILSKAPPPQPA